MAETTLRQLDMNKKSDLRDFIRVAWAVYDGDPNWVPPVIADEVTVLTQGGPFFEHAQGMLWIAERGGRPVGRIAALKDDNTVDKSVGIVGYFECINDQSVANMLFAAAETWLKQMGFKRIHGPISPNTIWSSPGVLVEGRPGPPNAFMPYSPAWYPTIWENSGYAKEVDSVAFIVDLRKIDLSSLKTHYEKLKTEGYVFRDFDKKHLARDIGSFVKLRNYTYPGKTPLAFSTISEVEEKYIVKMFGAGIEADLITVVEKAGSVVGMVVGFLDLGPMFCALDGRLGPIRLLKALNAKRKSNRGRIADIMTVAEEQGKYVAAAAPYLTLSNMIKRGFEEVEYSWVLETNTPSMRVCERAGGKIYRRYRFFQKTLA